MEPFTIIALLLGGMLAAGATVLLLSWRTIHSWVLANGVRDGYGAIVADRLANGDYHVVAGIFGPTNNEVLRSTWRANALDEYLVRQLEAGDGVIYVRT
jgi:hypothetical protein